MRVADSNAINPRLHYVNKKYNRRIREYTVWIRPTPAPPSISNNEFMDPILK